MYICEATVPNSDKSLILFDKLLESGRKVTISHLPAGRTGYITESLDDARKWTTQQNLFGSGVVILYLDYQADKPLDLSEIKNQWSNFQWEWHVMTWNGWIVKHRNDLGAFGQEIKKSQYVEEF